MYGSPFLWPKCLARRGRWPGVFRMGRENPQSGYAMGSYANGSRSVVKVLPVASGTQALRIKRGWSDQKTIAGLAALKVVAALGPIPPQEVSRNPFRRYDDHLQQQMPVLHRDHISISRGRHGFGGAIERDVIRFAGLDRALFPVSIDHHVSSKRGNHDFFRPHNPHLPRRGSALFGAYD